MAYFCAPSPGLEEAVTGVVSPPDLGTREEGRGAV